ncbi:MULTISPECIES: C40 family peptidase [Streptomyces]|uniref:Glycoside hydrolase n=1 Tax=Streptomyces venezuelae TaxID=54571 RepID=A0A5P2CKB5_STRVZ|nr:MULTISPECIES: C40 family peptidase [Streptomyces]NEA03470.1 C40 family peptidase [Streptomyces sp. SID10116]MYY84300.1 glycoside hydrolase [Streptomyces sp. SID335]MYZ18527.1 glycoside hydrolase [Streptomyces sp. SID337]NDZ91827.1 C40 family peptidase [Streptomyces sp. SID10115]NEB50066.1 C40 family peptidase [Streptomyces sp. SID339]
MSHTAHIPSHRKPRRSASKIALRAGVAGGVLSTLAVAAAAGTANAAEPVSETIEMPTLSTDLSAQIAQSADATQQAADTYESRAEQDAAASKAAKQAKEDLAKAEKKAEAERKAEAAAKKKAEEERASRSAERTNLSTQSGGGSTSASDSVAPASGSVGSVISFLKAQLGDAYVMGASGPNAWDCSSLVQAAFKQAGVDLPRVSQDQSTMGTEVGTSNLQVGDILYWGGKGSAYHVGVYIGNGQYLDAANPGKGVVIQDLSGYPASGAVRVL